MFGLACFQSAVFAQPSAVIVTTLAGSGTDGYGDGAGTGASFNWPTGVAVDSSFNVYVADSDNHKIRKITPGGAVATLAGSGSSGSADGTGTLASFSYPKGVAADTGGNLYVTDNEVDNNAKIRKITPEGVVTTLESAGISIGVAVDGIGNLYVNSSNNKILKITSEGDVTTLAGSGSNGSANGVGTLASFSYPKGVAVDIAGNVYVADTNNSKIRKITPTPSPSPSPSPTVAPPAAASGGSGGGGSPAPSRAGQSQVSRKKGKSSSAKKSNSGSSKKSAASKSSGGKKSGGKKKKK